MFKDTITYARSLHTKPLTTEGWAPTSTPLPGSLPLLGLLEVRVQSLLSQEAVLLCSVGVLRPHCRTGGLALPHPLIIHSRLTLRNRSKPFPPEDSASFISSRWNQLALATNWSHQVESMQDTVFHFYRFAQELRSLTFNAVCGKGKSCSLGQGPSLATGGLKQVIRHISN